MGTTIGSTLGFWLNNTLQKNQAGNSVSPRRARYVTNDAVRKLCLQEKQKLRYNYGVTEKQLLSYVRRARRAKGPTGEVLLQMLEMRLDSVVFRLGFAPTIRAARQYVSHGLIKIDGKRVNIPSYNCTPGETITSTSTPIVENCKTFGGTVPSHLSVDTNKTTGTIQRAITRSQIALTVNELLIIEFYSRKG